MNKYFFEDGINFECQQCSQCCDIENAIVYLSLLDQVSIAIFFKLSLKMTRDKFFKKENNKWVIDDKHSSKCRFLKEKKCIIYSVRPTQCRLYPFWENLLKNKKEFFKENCPGIGKGNKIQGEIIKKYFVDHKNFISSLEKEC